MADKKYGVLLGRFQPFHLGHGAIVDEIIADGLEPVIIIGSADKRGTEKNPLGWGVREDIIAPFLIRACSAGGNYSLIPIIDDDNWNEWWGSIWDELDLEGISLDECVFYINEKEQDRIPEYTIRSKTYVNAHYTDFYKDIGIDTKQVTYPELRGINISATDIRKDLESHKHFLHGSTYRYIKDNNLSLTIGETSND